MIRIVTDSSANLPVDLVKHYGIIEVPTHINWAGETLYERVDIDTADMLNRLEETSTLPSTSQASVNEYADVYSSLLAEDAAGTIISIHVSGALSGTLASAQGAAARVDGDVRVFDTRSCTVGHALLLREAAHMAAQGAAVDDIIQQLNTLRASLRIYIAVATLDILAQAGRLWRLAPMRMRMGDGMAIITLTDGALDGHEIYPNEDAALAALYRLVLEEHSSAAVGAADVRLGVQHALSPRAGNLASDLRVVLSPGLFLFGEMGPAFSFYFGRRTVAAAWGVL